MGQQLSKSSGKTDASRLLESSTDASKLLHELSSINNGTPSPVPAPSAARRATLVLGYGCLIAVNMASGLGVFGPSNAVISNAYPTAITPSGYAFAIWGIIFALEGAGIVYGSLPCAAGSVRATTMQAVHAAWLSMWTCENAWQLVFVHAPLSPNPSRSAQGIVLVPCSLLLLAALGSGIVACRQLTAAGVQSHAAGIVVALPSGINAGWLSAASCIGVALVLQCAVGGPLALNATGIPHALAATVTLGAVFALYKCGAGYVGLGYSFAVAWALRAIYVNSSNAVTTPLVRYLALSGACVVALAAAVAILRKFMLSSPKLKDWGATLLGGRV